jgi:hypothetical protein
MLRRHAAKLALPLRSLAKRTLAFASGLSPRQQVAGVVVCVLALMFGLFALYLKPQGFEQRNEAIRTFAQIIGGGALVCGLYFTARTVRNSSLALDHQRKDRQDDRFFRSAELLGDNESMDARIGALYALERLANDSDDYYPQVIEVISSFIRRRSSEKRSLSNMEWDDGYPKTPSDIETALVILGRRRYTLGNGEQTGLNLRGAYLCGIDISEGDYQLSDFSGALFVDSRADSVNFAGCKFSNCDLTNILWNCCILIGAQFDDAVVEGAKLFYFYWGTPTDPYRFIAKQVTTGTGSASETHYEYDYETITDDNEVNAGWYLNDSSWAGAKLKGTTITGGDVVGDDKPFDLSGMQYVDPRQYALMNLSSDTISPTLVDLNELGHSGKSDPS